LTVIEYTLGPEHTNIDGIEWFQFVDIIIDEVDLVHNPHYNTCESPAVCYEMQRIGISRESYKFVDCNVTTPRNWQWVTLSVYDPEHIVMMRLAFDENTNKRPYDIIY
jgi:hypothetical protein